MNKSSLHTKIAIAEDHQLIRKAISDMVNQFPTFNVIFEAENGIDFLQKLKQSHPLVPDIAIIDINMPKMDGYDLCKSLKESYNTIKILVLTMFDNEMAIINMVKSGANGYLLKDSHPDEFENALLELRDNEEYYSDYVSSVMAKNIRGEYGRKAELDLNEREIQFLKLAASEKTYLQIADVMNLAPRTIDGYRESLFKKLQVKSRVGLVLFAIKSGLVKI